jgi:radical SAM-linked protein
MVKIFIRSLRRANIPLKYSNGFHPLPKVTFGDTLPMGMESEQELMLVSLTEAIDPGGAAWSFGQRNAQWTGDCRL